MKAYTLKIRGGVERDSMGKKAGKGALIQEEVSATLGVNQDQTLFQPTGVGLCGYCLDDQGGQQISVRSDGKSPTLRAESHGNVPCVFSFEPGIQARLGRRFNENVSPTLRAEAGDNQPAVAYAIENHPTVICLEGHVIDRETEQNGKGWRENQSYTLNTIDRPAVAYCIGNGQIHDAVQMEEEVCKTLNCLDDPMKVMVAKNWDRGDIAGTLTANNAGGNQRMPDKGNFMCVVEKRQTLMDAFQHHGWRESETSTTLTAGNSNKVRGDTPLVVQEIVGGCAPETIKE